MRVSARYIREESALGSKDTDYQSLALAEVDRSRSLWARRITAAEREDEDSAAYEYFASRKE